MHLHKIFTSLAVSSLQNIFNKRAWNLEKFISENFDFADTGIIKIIPEQIICSSCSEPLSLSLHQPQGFLISTIILNCEVHVAKCTNTDCLQNNKMKSFSGIKIGIVNFNNKFFICVELIKEYFELYSKNGVKFTTWIKTKIDLFKFDSETPLYKQISNLSSYYGILHEAFWAASELFVYNKNDFYCCEHPEAIQIDATVNSIKMCRMPQFKQPWIKDTILSRTTTRKQRQLDQLDFNYKKIINAIVLGHSCLETTLLRLRNHNHTALKTLSFCMFKKDNLFYLDKSAEMFAKTLLKIVCAPTSIVPSNCVAVVSR